MATIYNIPEAVLLPWGYVVWVKEVESDHPDLEGRHATWDTDTNTIYLDKTKPIAERRWCLIHELGSHAVGDWSGWVHQTMNVKAPEAYNEPEVEETETA